MLFGMSDSTEGIQHIYYGKIAETLIHENEEHKVIINTVGKVITDEDNFIIIKKQPQIGIIVE